MPEPKDAAAAIVDKAKAQLSDRQTQIILGAAIGGLALGLWLGIRLAKTQPKNWVPAPAKPCPDCAQRSNAAGGVPFVVASPAEGEELRAQLEAQRARDNGESRVFSAHSEAPDAPHG